MFIVILVYYIEINISDKYMDRRKGRHSTKKETQYNEILTDDGFTSIAIDDVNDFLQYSPKISILYSNSYE